MIGKKSTMKAAKLMKTLPSVALVALAACVSQNLAMAGRAGGTPRVLPPDSHPYGKTYGAWSAEHWQWLYSLQVSQNPLFQDGAVDLSLNQPDGPVWFLGGTFSTTPTPSGGVIGTAHRIGRVPPGKALFFPIIDSEWDNAVPAGSPPTDYTTAELRANAAATMDGATGLACEIDGVSVKGLADVLITPYRVASPVFDYTLPLTDNVDQYFGYDITGPVTGAVADGVYLMLEPLRVGHHRIHFTGALPGFVLDITYDITVAP